MKMKGKTTGVHLGIEILTPLQCGSGEELFNELDYVDKDKQVFVVDQAQSFNEVASGDHDRDTLLACSNQLSDLVKLAGEYYGYALPMLNGFARVPEKIRAHLKDAFFQPYISGSALKGAIGTALIAEYLRSNSESYQSFLPVKNTRTDKPTAPKAQAAKNLLLDLLGTDPKQNIFRALHVKDAMFKPDQLRLVDIRWLNLTGYGDKLSAQWRSLSNRQSLSRWRDADGIYAEMLNPGSIASFQLQWDEFLLSEVKQWSNSKKDILPGNFDDLKTRLNNHASYRLRQEIDFYYRYGTVAPELECKKMLNRLKQDPNSIYMQLSWGSGWRGMTGDWLSPEAVAQMRELYNKDLGKLNMPFPKTRRLAVSGEPKLPLGWVRLYLYSHSEDRIEPAQNQNDGQHHPTERALEAELENFLKNLPEQDWDTRLLQELDKKRWSGEEGKQVAEKIKQLMINADKWHPEFKGTNKQKLKYKERSLRVLEFLNT